MTQRIAKFIASTGVGSRRDVEKLILAGKVQVNGLIMTTPAFNVTGSENILVDGMPVVKKSPRIWLFNKPRGCIVSRSDPQRRQTIFDILPSSFPYCVTIGRLDYNSEGLLILTNSGEIATYLESPKNKFSRIYDVRAYGKVTQSQLDTLQFGIDIDGIKYGNIHATIIKQFGSNVWMSMTLYEGKYREIRKICNYFNMDTNKLRRIAYGPFTLPDQLKLGEVMEINKTVVTKIMTEIRYKKKKKNTMNNNATSDAVDDDDYDDGNNNIIDDSDYEDNEVDEGVDYEDIHIDGDGYSIDENIFIDKIDENNTNIQVERRNKVANKNILNQPDTTHKYQ